MKKPRTRRGFFEGLTYYTWAIWSVKFFCVQHYRFPELSETLCITYPKSVSYPRTHLAPQEGKMQSRNKPYIGITDFTLVRQAVVLRELLNLEGSNRLLHVGVMMSYKTLHGLPTKWSAIFPDKEILPQIFVRREGVFNVLHYADYDDKTSVEDLILAVSYAGPDVDAIQLDMIWPDPHMLSNLKKHVESMGRTLQLIIQVNGKAIEKMSGDPVCVTQELHRYYRMDLLDYALFDLSGGQGKLMDSTRLLTFIEDALQIMPDLSVAVAGGLGPDTAYLAEPIIQSVPEVSLDAQSRLRLSGDARDPINWDRAAEYVRQAVELSKKYETVV